MSARTWGTTGRVTLEWVRGGCAVVHVDGAAVGHVEAPDRHGKWDAVAGERFISLPLPDTLDAAVMWVLRRAAPKVWREERGPVWRVKSCHGVRDRYGYRWRIYAPNGSEYTHSGATGTRDGWEWAMREIAYQLADPARKVAL